MSSNKLSRNDIAFLRAMRGENHPLKDFDWGALAGQNLSKISHIFCSDCDQRDGWMSYLGLEHPHPLDLGGGSLLIPMESPLNEGDMYGKVYEHQLRLTLSKIKPDIDTILLMHHLPCGAAALAGIQLPTQMLLGKLAKERVRGWAESVKDGVAVTSLVSVNYALVEGSGELTLPQEMRTYHSCRAAMEEWYKTTGLLMANGLYGPQVAEQCEHLLAELTAVRTAGV